MSFWPVSAAHIRGVAGSTPATATFSYLWFFYWSIRIKQQLSSRAGEMIVPRQPEDAPDKQDSSPEGSDQKLEPPQVMDSSALETASCKFIR
jgi:hypothetical protein